MDTRASDEELQLNSYDKLYLLMSKWKLTRLFNHLCFAADVTSIEDLESQVNTNLTELKSKVPGWTLPSSFSHDIVIVEKMIEDSKTVKFEDLPHLLDIQKNTYKEQLEDGGVHIIPKDHVSLRSKIALGRPYSGDVYNAQLTQDENTKIDVVLRCDFGPTHRDLFVREAKIMTGLDHEYIMKFYGAVILGPYAHSVGLVVEVFNNGNLDEFPVPSLFHAWLYASQLSSALEYLEAKNLVHSSVIGPFVYIYSTEKIKLGGFMCCYYIEEIARASVPGHHRDLRLSALTGHQGRHLDDLSFKGVVAMFAHVVVSMFRYLDSHLSAELLDLFSHDMKYPLVCPSGIAYLMERCMSSDVHKRPAFQEIGEVLTKEKPTKCCFTMDNSHGTPCELTYRKGEVVWVISQDTERFSGMWFGQKEDRMTGCFEREKAINIGDDDRVPIEIRARGIEAELAYRDAVLEGKVKVCRARLLIIGQDRAGKTSLKKSLLGLPFNPDEPSTEILEVNPSKFDFTVEQVVDWKAVNSDEDGTIRPEDQSVARLVASNMLKEKTDERQVLPKEEEVKTEEEQAIDPTQLSGVPQVLVDKLLSSLPTQDSSTSSEDSVDGYQERRTQKPDITMPKELTPLVAECLRRQESDEDGGFVRETVLDIWDFAGQHLHYATHPVFFSRKAVYLLVHNLRKNLDELAEPSFKHGEHTVSLKNTFHETNLDMLLSWLVSIHSIRHPPVDDGFINTCRSTLHCLPPPVLLVGTHADQVSARDIKEIHSKISSSLKGKAFHEHVLVPFYKVDNTKSADSSDIKAIRARVRHILSSGLGCSADLPVKWFNFEKALRKLATEKFYLTLPEIQNVARQECFIKDDKQLDAMLNYYHDLGLIVRFRDTVVLDTQWLINLFKHLSTIRPYQEQDPLDRELWEKLETTGVLHGQLIDRVFRNSLQGNGNKSLQQSVLDMMEIYGFLARFCPGNESDTHATYSSNNEIRYFVPAQLRTSVGDLWSLAPQDSEPHPLVFTFCGGFVPHGLFPQLISRLIARSSELKCIQVPKLYCNGARFFLGQRSEYDLILLCSKRGIKLLLKCYKDSSTNREELAVDSPAVKVRSLVEEELESLCTQWHCFGNVRYEVCVACVACIRSSTQCERHKSASCSDQDCLHLLPITNVEPVTLLTCPEQIGDFSRFTLTSLHKWYPCATPEEKTQENQRKLRKVADVDILNLAGEITCHKWKVIGRLLGLKDARLDEIEINKDHDVYEQRYQMLQVWKDSQSAAATCEQLKKALCHKLVMKNELAERFCYAENE